MTAPIHPECRFATMFKEESSFPIRSFVVPNKILTTPGRRDILALMTQSDDERRDNQRHRVPVEIRIKHIDAGEDGVLVLEADNLSAGGAFLSTDKVFDVGTILDVLFKLPDSLDTISSSARVVWINEGVEEEDERGMGIEFTYMTPEWRHHLDDMILKTAVKS